MDSILSFIGKELHWVQPSIFKREYFLREIESQENIASLIIRGQFKQVATVNIFEKSWTFTKPSFFRRTIDITEQGNTLPYAQYITQGFGRNGLIQLPRGDRFCTRWNFWKGRFTITTESGIEIATQEKVFSFKYTAKVFVVGESALLEKFPWALAIIYFLQLMQNRRN